MKNAMRPIHPGEILREELTALDLSANAFAKALVVSTMGSPASSMACAR